MKKFIGLALAAIGGIIGSIGTSACLFVVFDEPVYPESLD